MDLTFAQVVKSLPPVHAADSVRRGARRALELWGVETAAHAFVECDRAVRGVVAQEWPEAMVTTQVEEVTLPRQNFYCCSHQRLCTC